MRRRFDVGSGLVTAGAVVLFASLFLHWFGRLTAWASFEIVDWLLVALTVGALVGALRGGADPDAPEPWLPWVSVAALALVCTQVIDPPPAATGLARHAGLWLALAATATMAGGSVLLSSAISVTIDVRGRERRLRVAAVDRREGGAPPPPRAATPPPPPPPAARPPVAGEPPVSDAATEPVGPAAVDPADDPQRTQSWRAVEGDDEPGAG